MIKITSVGRSSAAGGGAELVAGAGEGGLGGGGSALDVAVVQQQTVIVGDAELPAGVVVFGEGDLAGDVGDDGSVAGEQGGVVVELGEGGEFDADVDHAAPVGRA